MGSLQILTPLNPDFVSVTYGAGGSTRKLTQEMTETIRHKYQLDVAAHLTCVEASKEETLAVADSYIKAGVTQIVALRGDPPNGNGFVPHAQGFSNSIELVSALANAGVDKIHVGAYPEPHPEARYKNADVDWLKRKIDAGASSAITQFFFDSDIFAARDRCIKLIPYRSSPAFCQLKIGTTLKNLPRGAGHQPRLTLTLNLLWPNETRSRISYRLLWPLIYALILWQKV